MKKYVTTFNQFILENMNIDFTENQKQKAQDIFKKLFDEYLKKVSPKTYPFIYHCTSFSNYDSILKNGLENKLNYFLEYDNDLNNYGFGEDDEEEPGIVCKVDFRDVIERLYPDPEWLLDIVKKTGNPSNYEKKGIDHRVIYCLIMTDMLNIDLDLDVNIDDIIKNKLDDLVKENSFCWMYVKGHISPELINIEIHDDLK